ncbi:anthrone oxygenase family protein [Actinomycetospora atypica]|uniref:Anthrone oxygenase family protein n=1 Tax=Actinomycetospora atypica TaxID=1290095 RepID=A0ABV9YN97_9PSEU
MDVVAVVTVVVVGLLVGVEFAVAVFVNPILDRLPGTAGLLGRSAGATVLGRLMPFWYIGATLLGVLWLVLGWGSAAVVPVGVGIALLVVAIVLSVTLLVPINDRVRTWSEGDAPADWRDQVGRWDRLHYGRTALLVLAFAAVSTGLSLV